MDQSEFYNVSAPYNSTFQLQKCALGHIRYRARRESTSYRGAIQLDSEGSSLWQVVCRGFHRKRPSYGDLRRQLVNRRVRALIQNIK